MLDRESLCVVALKGVGRDLKECFNGLRSQREGVSDLAGLLVLIRR